MDQQQDRLGLVLAGALVVLVIGGSIAGLSLTGGPGDARAKKLDNAKMQLLINVETQLYCHYLGNNAFPADRAALATLMKDGVNAMAPNTTIVTEQACDKDRHFSRYASNLPDKGFDYRLTEAGKPEVCVEFERSPRETDVTRPFRARTMFKQLSNLPDEPGRHCFTGPANPLEIK